MSLEHSLVGAAVAAFGAAYEAYFIRKGQQECEVALAAQYQHAISDLAQHIQAQLTAPLPVLLACTILAALETVRRNQGDALTHAQGAFELWKHHTSRCLDGASQREVDAVQASGRLESPQDLSAYICSNMDLMITSYAQDRTPALRSMLPGPPDSSFSSIDQAGLVLRNIMYSCLSFTSRMARFRCNAPKYHPPDSVNEQGRHLSLLWCWLSRFRETCLSAQKSKETRPTLAAVLEAQFLTEWIRISSTHSPYETFYDNYISDFAQILRCVESVLAKKGRDSLGLMSFSPVPGVIPSLRFVAMRCRHSQARRRAIELLKTVGIECPWHGHVEAAIARRIIMIEESGTLELHEPSDPPDLHERNRVCYHSVLDECFENHGLIHRMTIEFAQCADMGALISDQAESTSNLWRIWQEDLVIG